MNRSGILWLVAGLVLEATVADEGIRNRETTVTAGVLEGTITFRGEVPKARIPDDAGIYRDLVRVEPQTRGLKDAVVWLLPSKTNSERRVIEEKKEPAQMDQADHQFVPRVLAVQAGQPVKFTNSDPANHNVRTSSPVRTNEFNVFTGIDGSYVHRFALNPDGRPVRLGCDIHPWMRGWIYIFEHPFFAVTDEHGKFRIERVPAGEYTAIIEQPDLNYSERKRVAIAADTPKILFLEASKSGE